MRLVYKIAGLGIGAAKKRLPAKQGANEDQQIKRKFDFVYLIDNTNKRKN